MLDGLVVCNCYGLCVLVAFWFGVCVWWCFCGDLGFVVWVRWFVLLNVFALRLLDAVVVPRICYYLLVVLQVVCLVVGVVCW